MSALSICLLYGMGLSSQPELARDCNMKEHTFGAINVELTIGDIAAQHEFDAVVNVANAAVAPLAPTLHAVRRIRFVLHDRNALDSHSRVLEDVANGQ
jgi:hypothetical protein